MSTTEERIAVFQDTMNWIQTDPELSDAVAKARVATEVYFEDDYPSFVPVSY